MTRLTVVGAAVLAATLADAGEARPPRAFTPEQIVQVRTLGQFAISPDGKAVAYTIAGYYLGFPLIPRFGEENNVRVVSVETGEITQVTSGPFAKTNPVFSPTGDRIAYEAENDIWTVELATGITRRLTTSFAGVTSRSPSWSPDGTRIAFVSNREGGRGDVWVTTVEGERFGLVRLTSRGTNDDPQWSPDGRTIAFSAKQPGEDVVASGVYTVPASGGTPARLTPVDASDNFAPRWSPDGTELAFLSDRSGFVHVWVFTPSTGQFRGFDTANADAMAPYWEVQPVWSTDSRRILVSTNRMGSFELAAIDVKTGKVDTPGRGVGQYHEVGWSGGGADIVYAYENAWSPPDLYVRPLSGGPARRLTHSAHAYFKKEHTADIKRVSFTSADGLEVPGYLLTPRVMPPGRRLPAIVDLHPNSYGQFYFDNWNPFVHVLVNSGYAVLMVNQRGGSGYGRAYRDKLIGQWGTGTLDDVKAGAAFIKSQPFVDPERVGVMGLSMGGYLTLLSLTKAPELFRAGIDLMGITDLRSPFSPYRVGVDEKKDPDLYRRISPITSAQDLTAPLMILHSDQDKNVIPQQTYQLVDELDRLKKPYSVKIYPGEAHGLADPGHQLDSYERILGFFDAHLKSVGPLPGGAAVR